jgi:glycosyltransferase involved in cell wall biosynthesis
LKEPLTVAHWLWSGDIGGMERSTYNLVREQLKDTDLKVSVLFGRGLGYYYGEFKELGCPVTSFDLRSGFDLARLHSMMQCYKGYRIHHHHTPQVSAILASVLTNGSKVRIYTDRGQDQYSGKKIIRQRLTGFFLRRYFHAYSGNTWDAARVASRRYRIPLEKFTVAYNGVDFSLLEPERTRDEVCSELHIAPDCFIIGTAAKLRPLKRIDKLIRACSLLRRSDYRIVILGEGPDRRRLEQIAIETGISDKIVFTGMKEKVADYLSVMNVFVLPSNIESFGNAAVEAMALGVPTIIFADGGGLLEHIQNRKTGFIVRDERELAERINALLDNENLRRSIGESGKSHVRARYSLEQMARRYKEIYYRAVGNSSAAAGSKDS